MGIANEPVAVVVTRPINLEKDANALFHLPIPEVLLMLVFVAVGITMSVLLKLPISLPDSTSLAFTGMGYTIPAILAAAGLLLTWITQKTPRTLYFLIVLLSYAAILIIHFNIKLWITEINPASWDQPYQRIDEALSPLVNASFAIRRALGWLGNSLDLMYLFAFLAMFGCSIIVHSSRSFIVFRKAVLTAMLVHVLGALSYLIAPALGPFLYEAGANALESKRQVYMLALHNDALAGGTAWLEANGAKHLATGLAAMPSLHVASSAVFVYYAWVYERRLCWLYLPLFIFIINEAVATRWHYLVDIIAGIGLTAIAIALTEAVFSKWIFAADYPDRANAT